MKFNRTTNRTTLFTIILATTFLSLSGCGDDDKKINNNSAATASEAVETIDTVAAAEPENTATTSAAQPDLGDRSDNTETPIDGTPEDIDNNISIVDILPQIDPEPLPTEDPEPSPDTTTTPTTEPTPGTDALVAMQRRNVTTLTIKWLDRSNNEEGFRIERSIGNSDNFLQLANLPKNQTSYQDTNVPAGQTYCYRISSYNPSAVSAAEIVCQAAPSMVEPVL